MISKSTITDSICGISIVNLSMPTSSVLKSHLMKSFFHTEDNHLLNFGLKPHIL